MPLTRRFQLALLLSVLCLAGALDEDFLYPPYENSPGQHYNDRWNDHKYSSTESNDRKPEKADNTEILTKKSKLTEDDTGRNDEDEQILTKDSNDHNQEVLENSERNPREQQVLIKTTEEDTIFEDGDNDIGSEQIPENIEEGNKMEEDHLMNIHADADVEKIKDEDLSELEEPTFSRRHIEAIHSAPSDDFQGEDNYLNNKNVPKHPSLSNTHIETTGDADVVPLGSDYLENGVNIDNYNQNYQEQPVNRPSQRSHFENLSPANNAPAYPEASRYDKSEVVDETKPLASEQGTIYRGDSKAEYKPIPSGSQVRSHAEFEPVQTDSRLQAQGHPNSLNQLGSDRTGHQLQDPSDTLPQPRSSRNDWHPTLLSQSVDKGSYCATRPGESCCVGRNDGCSVQYHDTLCYCDIFCDRSGTDCCPDFVATCGSLLEGKDGLGLSSARGVAGHDISEYRYPDDQLRNTDRDSGVDGKNKLDDGGRYGKADGFKMEGDKQKDSNKPYDDSHFTQNRDWKPGNFGHEDINSGYPEGSNGRNENNLGNFRGSGGRSGWEYDQGVSDHDRTIEGVDGRSMSSDDRRSNGQFGAFQPQTIDGLPNNCHHRGKLYQPGDGIKENCNNCTCVNAVLKKEYNWKCTQKICLIRPELLDHVSSTDCGWQAQNYSFFWGLSAEDGLRYKLGTLKPSDSVNRMTMLNVRVDDELPQEFDARQYWPGLISDVIDQGFCASSWAASTAGVATDRLRIHSGGAYKDVTLSTQHLVSCVTDNEQHGCSSAHVDRAWWFMRKVGLVSNECYPYTVGGRTPEPTERIQIACLLPKSYEALKTAQCPQTGVPLTVYRASPPYKIAPNEREIMKELMTNGPLQAIMEVKEDFYMYKSGVYSFSLPAEYQTDTERNKRYHSVRIVGWGVDRSNPSKEVKYWICANSWGKVWGEDGYFRILRGADESSIESHVVGVWLKVNDRMLIQRQGIRSGVRGGANSNNRRRLVRHSRRLDRLLHQHRRMERMLAFRQLYKQV